MNDIFVESNARRRRFIEFTNCNLSQRSIEPTSVFFNDVEEREFPSNCTKSYVERRDRFFSTVTSVLQLHTV